MFIDLQNKRLNVSVKTKQNQKNVAHCRNILGKSTLMFGEFMWSTNVLLAVQR